MTNGTGVASAETGIESASTIRHALPDVRACHPNWGLTSWPATLTTCRVAASSVEALDSLWAVCMRLG